MVPLLPVLPVVPAATAVLAHSTGFSWDEALMVMAPIAAVAGVLFLVNSRAKKLDAAGDEPGSPTPPPSDPAEAPPT